MPNLLLNHLWRLAPRMPAIRKLAFFIAFAFCPLISRATNLTLQGNFTADDNAQLFSVSLAAPAAVDFRSYGYGGGTTSTGTVVAPGGFDTILTLFSASGTFMVDADDGAGAAVDPSTGMQGDARITADLAAGNYILALTQFDNFSVGDLADGFARTGNPNFTADPTFTSGGACPGNMFRDISGTAGRCRSGNWTVDFLNVSSAAPAAVPEPSALLFCVLGLGLLLLCRLRNRRKAPLLTCAFAAVLAGVPVEAQSNCPSVSGPDYCPVSDFLNGQRTLLNISDIEVYSSTGATSLLTTSNSGLSFGSIFGFPGVIDTSKAPQIFSGHIFNQSQGTTVKPLYDYGGSAPNLLTLWFQAVNTASSVVTWTPLSAGDKPNINAGLAADFTQDGYDELALSFDDGRLLILSPNDVNDPSKNFKQGIANLDVLKAMTAGDFDGDGKREIAGLTVLPSGGLKLVIYSVNSNLVAAPVSSLVLTTTGTSTSTPITSASIARGRFTSNGYDQLAVTFAAQGASPIVEVVDFAPKTLNAHEGPQLSPPISVPIPSGFLQVQTGKFKLPDDSYDQIVWHESSISDGGRFFELITVDLANLALTTHLGVNYNQFPCASGIQVGNFDHRQSDASNPAQTGYNPNAQISLLYCSGNSGGDLQYILNIYSVDPSSGDVINSPSALLLESKSGFPRYGSSVFVPVDLQGRSLVLGEPSKLTINAAVQPAVSIGIPPMHMDFIPNDARATVPPVPFNVSAVPDGFYAQYQIDQSSGTGSTSTNGTSWSFGAKEQVSNGFSLGDPDITGLSVTDTFTAAQNLKGAASATHGSYQSETVDLTVPSGVDDSVNYSDDTIHIWAYPVLGQMVCPVTNPPSACTQKVPLTIQFSAVDGDAVVANKQGYMLQWYQPVWEPFNIFSYPANYDQLKADYPNLHILSTPQSFATDGTSVTEQIAWNVTGKDESTTSLNQNYSFENDFSASLKESVPAVESDSTSFQIDLSGSFGFNSLTKNTTDLGLSTGVKISKNGTFPEPQTYAYSINPYILGTTKPGGYVDVNNNSQTLPPDVTTFGQVMVAYTVSIDLNNQAWWLRAYGTNSDVALNHPSRWQVGGPQSSSASTNCLATGNSTLPTDCLTLSSRVPTDAWTSVFHEMRGFFISKEEFPGQGPQLQESKVTDDLRLQARVYNYSLAAMPANSKVHTQFFFAPYDPNVGAIDDTNSQFIDEYISDGPIPPFDSTSSTPNWIMAGVKFQPSLFDYTKAGGVAVAFWVLTWVEDGNNNLVQEINGHGLTGKPPAKPNHVSSFAAAAALEQCQAGGCYSNNLGIYHLPYYIEASGLGSQPGPAPGPGSFNLDKIQISDRRVALGRDVRLSTNLSASGMEAPGAVVTFYDGDPKHNGRAFAIESVPYIRQGSAPLVRATYRANRCGLHQLFMVMNEGKPTEVVRRAPPLRVVCDVRE